MVLSRLWLPSVVALAVAAGGPGRSADPPARDAAEVLQQRVRAAVERVEPSVVAVIVSHNPNYPLLSPEERKTPGKLGDYPAMPARAIRFGFGPQPTEAERKLDLSNPKNAPDNQLGSGVVIDDAGLVLTTYRLIENATKVYVRLPTGDGSYADIHAADARSDLAVLKLLGPPPGLSAATLATVRLGDDRAGRKPATVFRGQFAALVAHSSAAGFADGSPTASVGTVGTVRRRAEATTHDDLVGQVKPLYQLASLIQTDARLIAGSDGGAVVNLDGEVIGLATTMAAVAGSEAAGGFAIPMDANYRRIVEVLRQGREVEYGWLGVQSRGEGFSRPGIEVDNVVPGMPAARGGVRRSDRIRSVDGNPVQNYDDLILYVGGALAGTKVTLSVVRQGQEIDLSVTLTKAPNSFPFIASRQPPPVHGLRVDYLSSVGLVNPNGFAPDGVAVRDIIPDSPAEVKFKPLDGGKGWVVTAVNGEPVTKPDDFYAKAGPGGPVRLRLVNVGTPAGGTRDITLP